MWLIMRGALSEQVKLVHKQTYAPSVTNIATLVFEDLGGTPDPALLRLGEALGPGRLLPRARVGEEGLRLIAHGRFICHSSTMAHVTCGPL